VQRGSEHNSGRSIGSITVQRWEFYIFNFQLHFTSLRPASCRLITLVVCSSLIYERGSLVSIQPSSHPNREIDRFHRPQFTSKPPIMPAPSQILRAARPAFRSQFFTAQSQVSRSGFKSKFGGRRWQSTAAPTENAQQSWFKRMWDSPIGLKTVHFWFVLLSFFTVLLCAFWYAEF